MGYVDNTVTISRDEYGELKKSDGFCRLILEAAEADDGEEEESGLLRLGPGGEFVRGRDTLFG